MLNGVAFVTVSSQPSLSRDLRCCADQWVTLTAPALCPLLVERSWRMTLQKLGHVTAIRVEKA